MRNYAVLIAILALPFDAAADQPDDVPPSPDTFENQNQLESATASEDALLADGWAYVAVTFGTPDIADFDGENTDRKAVFTWAHAAKNTGRCTNVYVYLSRDPANASIAEIRSGKDRFIGSA